MSTQIPAEEHPLPTIGPIPLAAFIAMCLFAPFFVSFASWLFYINTIKRCKDHKHNKIEAEAMEAGLNVSREVEMQALGFVQAPAPAKPTMRKELGNEQLETNSFVAATPKQTPKEAKMAPFYPYFPISTAPRAPIATGEYTVPHPPRLSATNAMHNGTHHHDSGACTLCGHKHESGVPCPVCNCGHHHDGDVPCALCGHNHHNGLPCPQCGCGYHQDGTLTLPPNSSNTPLSLTVAAPPGCDGCEPPLLPDLHPAAPASTQTSNSTHEPCQNSTVTNAINRLQLRNGTVAGSLEFNETQTPSPDNGPVYHSKQTGQVLMVVIIMAGAALAVASLYGVGMACWKYTKGKADKQPVTNV
ncbi:hypothetical protein PMIN04_008731 [Paraphaeosphaeria minitans]